LTLRLGPEGIQKIKARLRSMRQELIELAESEAEVTQVVHVGFQVFPLADVVEEER
jgi:hypothetical protein